MTATTIERLTTKMGEWTLPDILELGVKASTSILAGTLVCSDTSGYVVAGATGLNLVALGRAEESVDNSGGSNGALKVTIRQGVFPWANSGSTDAIAASDRGKICYIVDNQTVALTDGAGTRSPAGTIVNVDGSGVWVATYVGAAGIGAAASGGGGILRPAEQPAHEVRGASTANIADLAAASVSQDGLTFVAGERILVWQQSTASQNGIYQFGTVALGVAPLTRVADFNGPSEVVSGAMVFVSEGTTYADQLFTLTTNDPITVGTSSLTFVQLGSPGTATPAAVGTAAVGTSRLYSRQDHVHAHGNQVAGASMHAAASPSVPGFNSTRTARGVCSTNMSTSAFVGVDGGTAQDGVTYVEGDIVLLAGQTTGHENGPWVVGVVAAGTAPLTRPVDWAATAAIPQGATYQIGAEGTLYGGTTWKAMATGTPVVGTDDPLFYPKTLKATFQLASGTYTVGDTEGLYLFSTTKSTVTPGRIVSSNTSLTVAYQALTTGRTAGKRATAAVTVEAAIAAGTINTADDSTLEVTVTNW